MFIQWNDPGGEKREGFGDKNENRISEIDENGIKERSEAETCEAAFKHQNRNSSFG